MKPTTDDVLKWARDAGFIENGDEQAFADYVFVLMLDVDNFTKVVALAYAAGAKAMQERCAKVCEAEESRILSRQSGRDYDPVDTNLRMIACVLPDIAAAIRAQEDADE